MAQTLAAIETHPVTEGQVEATTTPGATKVATATLPVATASPSAVPTRVPSATPTVSSTATLLPTLTATLPPPPVTSTPAPTNTPAVVPSTTTDCIDKAAFVADVTIPDETLVPTQFAFTKTWRIKNVGTCTWGAGYQLVFGRGNILGAPPASPLPAAAPGAQIDVSINLVSPAQGGKYAGDWQFQNATGKRFGVNSHGEDFIFVIIKVDWGPGIGPTAAPPPVNCAYARRADIEGQLLQLINQARVANGVAPLTLQDQLTAAAFVHSADMACNNYLDHSGSDKSTYSSRIRAQGYVAKSDTENIFAGGDAQTAFDWWMGSPIHRANILDKKMTQIGIGSVTFAKSNFGTYYTLTFARP